jgi:hypothetical protein
MKEIVIIETIAISVGIIVIIIETYIIFLLKKHLKVLDSHLDHNDALLKEFKKSIDNHLMHLNRHSHNIETSIKNICEPIQGNKERIRRPIARKRKENKLAKNVSSYSQL